MRIDRVNIPTQMCSKPFWISGIVSEEYYSAKIRIFLWNQSILFDLLFQFIGCCLIQWKSFVIHKWSKIHFKSRHLSQINDHKWFRLSITRSKSQSNRSDEILHIKCNRRGNATFNRIEYQIIIISSNWSRCQTSSLSDNNHNYLSISRIMIWRRPLDGVLVHFIWFASIVIDAIHVCALLVRYNSTRKSINAHRAIAVCKWYIPAATSISHNSPRWFQMCESAVYTSIFMVLSAP